MTFSAQQQPMDTLSHDVNKVYEPRKGVPINCDTVRTRQSFPRDYDYLRFFGYCFRRDTLLKNSSTRTALFNLLKFHIQPFATVVSGSYDRQQLEESADHIVYFLDFLLQEASSEEAAFEIGDLRAVLVELAQSLQFAGRTSECVPTVDVRPFHLLLKLWETSWKISCIVDQRFANSSVSVPHSSVLSRLLFWDLLATMKQTKSTSCACLQEILVEVVQSRSSTFWDDLSKVQDDVVSLEELEWSVLPANCREVLPAKIQLELVSSLLQKGVQLAANPAYCRLLLLSTISRNADLATSAAKLLASTWPGNAVELLMPVLDYFLTNLDESYDKYNSLAAPGSIEQFVGGEISARSLVNLCEAVCMPNIKQSNPFHECLSLCACVLRTSTPNGSSLRQITGRIYLKLSRARVLTFSQSGTTNFTLIMLLLARYSADATTGTNTGPADVLKRFQERVLPPQDLPLTSPRIRLLAVCMASFQLLFNLLQCPIDLRPVLSFVLQRLCKDSAKVHSSEVVPPLLELLEDLATAGAAVDNGLIFYPEIRALFDKSSRPLQLSILSTSSSILERIYSQTHGKSGASSKNDDTFLPSAVSVALPMAIGSLSTITKFSAGDEIRYAADLCAAIAIALSQQEHRVPAGSTMLADVVQEIARYVTRQPVFVAQVFATLANRAGHDALVKAWQSTERMVLLVKLIMYVRPPNHEMDVVTRVVLKNAQDELVQLDGRLLSQSTDFMACYEQLVSGWSRHHRQLLQMSSIAEAAAFRKAVRGLLGATVNFDARSVAELPTAQVSHLYRVVAVLFSEAPDMLYTKGLADCPLPRLIETFVYPKALIREGKTALPRVHVECMRNQGHRFLLGLAQLLRDNDALIARRLTEVVAYYCKVFPQATPIAMFLVQTAKESPHLTKIMIDTVWSLDIDRAALVDLLLAIVKRCSETFSSAAQITNVHLPLLTKLASICSSVQLAKLRLLLEACLLPCGVHCSRDQTRVVGPLMATSLCSMDISRSGPLLELIATAWPELAHCILEHDRIRSVFVSTESRRQLEQIKEKLRQLGVS